MADAKKLTAPQIVALRAAAKGESVKAALLAGGRLSIRRGAAMAIRTTLRALERRGLIVYIVGIGANPHREGWTITPAGRQALFEATGENTAPEMDAALQRHTAPALEVVEIATGKVVRTVELHGKTPSQIEKVEMGMLRNMDLERFSVRTREN